MSPHALKDRWLGLWKRLGVDNSNVEFLLNDLLICYGMQGREYHNTTHLKDVLEKLDWAKAAMAENGELSGVSAAARERMFDQVEMALWYHDIVYSPARKDNETRSAELFYKQARDFGMPADTRRNIAGMIALTADHKQAQTIPEKILTDCDLSILGADKETFAKYDRGIRAEYAHVPALAYAAGRRKVLKGFLDQPAIFKTYAFRAKFEKAARANLKAATANPVRRLFMKLG
jgi:predicted metal-dependent HD superfamily phosphohydrolase